MNGALKKHADYMRRWTGQVQTLVTPCCGKGLVVAAPSHPGHQWDSLCSCPYCDQMFMKVVTSTSAEGRVPRLASGVPS